LAERKHGLGEQGHTARRSSGPPQGGAPQDPGMTQADLVT
jgi:hypothetical protein